MSLEDTMCVGPRRPLPSLTYWVSVPPPTPHIHPEESFFTGPQQPAG